MTISTARKAPAAASAAGALLLAFFLYSAALPRTPHLRPSRTDTAARHGGKAGRAAAPDRRNGSGARSHHEADRADLTDRERGIMPADTAAQAQAALLEIARRVGKDEQLDVRGGDFGPPKAFGDYGLVYATITFECHIEQLVNFLSSLAHQPELVVPSEERINSAIPKTKP